jgi:serine/threonine protein kinase/tetratricopeptide (TPR) repeat protein
MGVVHKASDTRNGAIVAVKTVVDSTGALLATLRAEVVALRSLEHPYVISILDDGLSETLPWYAMEWIDGQTLAAHNLDLWRASLGPSVEVTATRTTSVPFAESSSGETGERPVASALPESLSRPPAAGGKLVESLQSYRMLCDALMHIHGLGIVHRDLKPSNVMLRRDGTPVLMDFGIASRAFGGGGRDRLDLTSRFMGSALYAAPEQIRGDVVDPRADLYSLGCMLYETLTGRPPFLATTPRQIHDKHLNEPPTPPAALVEGIPSELDELALRLLQKQPRDRIGHADDVASLLSELAPPRSRPSGAFGRTTPQPHLYRPSLAGRGEASDQVRSHLDAAAQGHGRVVFIKGVSGIGKTFFAADIARDAQRRGFGVVVGECRSVSAGTGTQELHPGQLYPFRSLLQVAADRCRERGSGYVEGAVGDAITDLAAFEPALLPFANPDSSPLNALPPEAKQLRIAGALTEIAAWCAADGPLLIILDDLHWADELSVACLEALTEVVPAHPVLLVVLFRPEEAGGRLASLVETSRATELTLDRLPDEALLAMTRDMLAMANPPEAFLRIVVRRSDGNPFYAAEFLRLLAQERILRRRNGTWVLEEGFVANDTPREGETLPRSIKDLVARRLRQLDPEPRKVLEAAAVMGRSFDDDTLAALVGLDAASVEVTLRELAIKQVLERVAPGQHRFVHDQLRAAAYEDTHPDRRRALHRTVGHVLEQRCRTVAEDSFAQLAHHFRHAGEGSKAALYLEKAAEHALSTFANREAVRLFEDLLATPARGDGMDERLRRARWERGLGDALHGLGKLDESRTHLENALRLLGESPPARVPRLAMATMLQVFAQGVHRTAPTKWVGRYAGDALRLREAAQAYDRLLQIFYYRGQQLEMMHATMKTLNLSERAGSSPGLAQAYAIAHAVAGVIPIRPLAESYLASATSILSLHPDPAIESYLELLTGVYRSGTGEWDRALGAFERGLQIASTLSFHRRRDELLLGLSNWHFLRGGLAAATARSEGSAFSPRRGDPQAHAWKTLMRAQVHLVSGDHENALASAHEAARLVPSLMRSEVLWTFAVLSSALLMQGDREAARRRADDALKEIVSAPPLTFYCIESYSRVCDVYLTLWEDAVAQGRPIGDLPDRATQACKALRAFARIFPAAEPRAALHQGTFDSLRGQAARASSSWQASQDAARRLGMPLDEAAAGWRLAATAPGTRAARAVRLEDALRFARNVGALALARRIERDEGGG